MGREWYWSGRSSKRGGAGGEKDTASSGCMNAVFQFFDFHQFQFALHHQQPSFEPTCILPEEPTNPKGVEAPRNSLQSEELSLSYITREREEEDDDFNIPMGIQIKTSGHTGSKAGVPNDFSSEISSSPGTKTPSLVARLMGLDLLPETRSPFSPSSTHGTPNPLSKSHSQLLRPPQPLQSRLRNILDNDITGTRSLPETPRISSARRSDVQDHRLSLQINKENLCASEDLEFSRFSYLRRKERRVDDEINNRSPSQYARQIVKQMKEKVSRKAGLDITNTITNRDQGRTELVSQFKSRKSSTAFTKVVEESSPGKHSAPSCSPRLRFSEPKIKSSTTQASSKDKAFHYSKPSSSLLSPSLHVQQQQIKVPVKPKPQPLQKQQQQQGQKSIQKGEKIASERFGQRLKKPPQTSDIIRNKQEEPFVRPSIATRANIPEKKCKKTPLSNDLLNITVPTLLPVKKDPSSTATIIPQKQSQVFDAQESRCSSQLSSCTSQKYKPETTHKLMARESIDDRSNGASTTGASGAEYEYVSNILSRTGIDKDTLVPFSNWFSPSHPLDPSIFHQLEYAGTATSTATFTTASTEIMPSRLGYECNQKLLLFHLVDELLVAILKPYIDMNPWASSNGHGFCHMQGSQLIDTLCAKIRSFPCADCRVLEDIDALIDKDLPRLKLQSAMAFEEEGEEIVTEIEKDILDTLLHETALEFWWGVLRTGTAPFRVHM